MGERYTKEEIEALKKIVGFNSLVIEGIEKYGWDKTGVALCLSFFDALDENEPPPAGL